MKNRVKKDPPPPRKVRKTALAPSALAGRNSTLDDPAPSSSAQRPTT